MTILLETNHRKEKNNPNIGISIKIFFIKSYSLAPTMLFTKLQILLVHYGLVDTGSHNDSRIVRPLS